MKQIVFSLFILLLSANVANAANTSSYFDHGLIYSGSSFPVDVAKINCLAENLKRGEAVTNNILGIVETGDRGIHTAAKNGGIRKIQYVDTKVSKVYIPLGFIPIYVKQTKTIVYGE